MKYIFAVIPFEELLEEAKSFGMGKLDFDLIIKKLSDAPFVGKLLHPKIPTLRCVPWEVVSTGLMVDIAYVVHIHQGSGEVVQGTLGFVALARTLDEFHAEMLDINSLISLMDACAEIGLHLLKFL